MTVSTTCPMFTDHIREAFGPHGQSQDLAIGSFNEVILREFFRWLVLFILVVSTLWPNTASKVFFPPTRTGLLGTTETDVNSTNSSLTRKA
ncbi:hypothetical protein DI396_16105 [Litorivita pollutaquae]|uniref:Uncharacterized protein n=1 Tax=Litorivita pollutaquae TaxID=2200892 RepID=A0A2V4N9U5_9RHOB|nr:hypothetical protein DI396_16105 [Litorivita pollutaquae]